jgi:hypothetical protein
MNGVTVTLTTCGRIDLLKRTIESFLKTNTYEIDEYLIINDNPLHGDEVREIFKNIDNCSLFLNTENVGQKRCLDTIFTEAKNEYIFHLEDDWMFDASNYYIEKSLNLLASLNDIHQVWVRHEYDTPHKTTGDIISTKDIQFKVMDSNFNGHWNGYSWNPGLRRKSDYLKMFPNGISQFKDELQCALHTRNFNYKAVMLQPTSCYHIGYDRSTYST